MTTDAEDKVVFDHAVNLHSSGVTETSLGFGSDSEDESAVVAEQLTLTYRFKQELRSIRPIFGPEDPVHGFSIDLPSTFSPKERWALFFKSGFFLMFVLSILLGLMRSNINVDNGLQSLIFMSIWCQLISCLYWPLTMMVAFIPRMSRSKVAINMLWGLTAMLLPVFTYASVGFWINVAVHPLNINLYTYENIMCHGGTVSIMFLDAIVLNRVPLRLKQCWLPMGLMCLYYVWHLIHSFTDIGNPFDEDDDSIYSGLHWHEDVWALTSLWVSSVFALMPIAHVGFWISSLYSWPCSFQGLRWRRLSDGIGKESMATKSIDSV